MNLLLMEVVVIKMNVCKVYVKEAHVTTLMETSPVSVHLAFIPHLTRAGVLIMMSVVKLECVLMASVQTWMDHSNVTVIPASNYHHQVVTFIMIVLIATNCNVFNNVIVQVCPVLM